MTGFIVTGTVTVIFSLLLQRLRNVSDLTRHQRTQQRHNRITFWTAKRLAPKNVKDPLRFWIDVLERLVLQLSDQQLLTGLSLLAISYATFWPPLSISLQWTARIALFSQITHAATLMALRRYFSQYFWMTLVRLIITVSSFILWAILALFDIQYNNALLKEGQGAALRINTTYRIIELTGLTWTYLSVIAYVYVSDNAVQARSEVSQIRADSTFEAVQDWIKETRGKRLLESSDQQSRFERYVKRSITELVITFYHSYMQSRSVPVRLLLWSLGEVFIPWK